MGKGRFRAWRPLLGIKMGTLRQTECQSLELFYLQNFAHTIRMPDIKYPASDQGPEPRVKSRGSF